MVSNNFFSILSKHLNPKNYACLAVFLFCALILVVPKGAMIGGILLVIGGLFFRKNKNVQLAPKDYGLVAVLLAYAVIDMALNYWHHEPLRQFDLSTRFLLAIVVLVFLRRFPPYENAFWLGVITGSIAAGGLASWQFFIQNNLRPGGFVNSIQFGGISMLLGIFCLTGLLWGRQQTRFKNTWIILLILAAMSGIWGSILSGSRGSWLLLPIAVIATIYQQRDFFKQKKHYFLLTIMGIMVFSIVIVTQTSIEKRIDLLTTESKKYFTREETNTSIGIRLELWRGAFILFPQHPWLGIGQSGFSQQKKQLIQQQKLSLSTNGFTHLHNDFLDILIKHGILGLISLLLLYGIPLLFFLQKLRDKVTVTIANKIFSLAGVWLVVGYASFGLSQAFLTHQIGVIFYCFMLVILWALACANNQNGGELASYVK